MKRDGHKKIDVSMGHITCFHCIIFYARKNPILTETDGGLEGELEGDVDGLFVGSGAAPPHVLLGLSHTQLLLLHRRFRVKLEQSTVWRMR